MMGTGRSTIRNINGRMALMAFLLALFDSGKLVNVICNLSEGIFIFLLTD